MALTTASSSSTFLGNIHHPRLFSRSPPFFSNSKSSPVIFMSTEKKCSAILNPQSPHQRLFYEGREEVEVDVFKKLEKRKVLSNVEKSGLLSKAESLGLTLSSIEKLGVLSKAEELGLLSLLENAVSISPAAIASVSLPIFVAAISVIVFIPDDSTALLAAQYLLAGTLGVAAVGLLLGSVVLEGLQEAD